MKREESGIVSINASEKLLIASVNVASFTSTVESIEKTREERKAQGIENLPSTLQEATREFEKSEFVKDVLGEHIFSKYLAGKKQEWESYTTRITQWDIEEYLTKY